MAHIVDTDQARADVESFINTSAQLWQCTYDNPEAYVAFTDDGCASRIRYGAAPLPSAGYESCLRSGYAGLRWSCASSATHFVMNPYDTPARRH